MAPYGYFDNKLRDHATSGSIIPITFNLKVKYRNIKDYREALNCLVDRYQDHKTDPDILSGLKSINNYSIINSDKNKTILIKVNQNDHITAGFPISDVLRVYLDTSIYKIMTYEELLENLEEEHYNREVNADMEKNRDQWEAIMRQAENKRNPATTSGDNESLTDPDDI